MRKIAFFFSLLVLVGGGAARAESTIENAVVKQANGLMAQGKYADAIAVLTPYINGNPADTQARLTRAYAYSDLGKYDLSITDFDASIVLDGNSWQAYNGRCQAHYNLAQFQQAIDDCTASIKIAPTGDAYRYRVFALLDSGKTDDALVDATAYAAAYPALSRPLAVKCAVEYRMKNYDAARTDCTNALALPGVEYTGRKYAGLLAQQAGDWKTMEARFGEILADVPQDQLSLYNRAYARFRLKEYADGLTDVNAYVNLAGSDADGYFLRAEIESALNMRPKAKADYSTSIVLYKKAGDASSASTAQLLLNQLNAAH